MMTRRAINGKAKIRLRQGWNHYSHVFTTITARANHILSWCGSNIGLNLDDSVRMQFTCKNSLHLEKKGQICFLLCAESFWTGTRNTINCRWCVQRDGYPYAVDVDFPVYKIELKNIVKWNIWTRLEEQNRQKSCECFWNQFAAEDSFVLNSVSNIPEEIQTLSGLCPKWWICFR